MVVPVVESNAILEDDFGSSLAVSKPSGTVEGDLLLGLTTLYLPSEIAVTPPSGWSEDLEAARASYSFSGIWHKVAGGSEGSSYSWTWSGNNTHSGAIVRISGVDPDSPVDATGASSDGYGATGTCPSITTTVDDCLILRVLVANYIDPADVTDPGSHARVLGAGSNAAAPCIVVASSTQATQGATGTEDFTWAGSKVWKAFTIAIAPPASPAGPKYAQTASSQSGSGGTEAWVDPDNAKAVADVTVAALLPDTPDGSEYLWLTNFGFNLPSGATVDGITAAVNRQSSRSDTVYDLSVRLINGGSVAGDDNADTPAWDNTTETKTYGGSTDDWGLTLDDTDVNATNFGIAIAAYSDDEEDAEINWVTLTINWTAGAGGGTTIRRGLARLGAGEVTGMQSISAGAA